MLQQVHRIASIPCISYMEIYHLHIYLFKHRNGTPTIIIIQPKQVCFGCHFKNYNSSASLRFFAFDDRAEFQQHVK